MSELTHVRITASEAGCEEFAWALGNRVKTGATASFIVSKACAAEFTEACIDGQPVPDPGIPTPPPDPAPPYPDPPWSEAIEWDWTRPSQVFELAVGQYGVSITFVPDREGEASGFTFPPKYINPQYPQGYPMTVALSTVEGDYSPSFPWGYSGDGAKMRFQVGGTSAYQPVLKLGVRYYLNARVDQPAGSAPVLLIEAHRPA